MPKMQYVLAAITLSLLSSYLLLAQDAPMTFFLTSVGPGNGANQGGLAGADRHCQMLAETVGAGDRTWRAYLSTQGPDAVNARDRIGQGPLAQRTWRTCGSEPRPAAQDSKPPRNRRSEKDRL